MVRLIFNCRLAEVPSIFSVFTLLNSWWLAACERYLPYCQPASDRRTSQKIWGGFLYGVYSPEEWHWRDSSGRNGM